MRFLLRHSPCAILGVLLISGCAADAGDAGSSGSAGGSQDAQAVDDAASLSPSGAVEDSAWASLPCRPAAPSVPLPDELRESSGADFSLRHPGVLWTHNDSGSDPLLFAVDSAGNVRARVRVVEASNQDWEDLAVGRCSPVGEGSCVWIADTGDNAGARDRVTLYRVPEPALDDDATERATHFPVRYPEGPRDAEALALDPEGVPYIVTKGRSEGIALYRYPPPLRPGEAVALERVHAFTGSAAVLPDQVTGADWSDDGRWLAIRTYAALHLWRMHDGRPRAGLVDAGVPLESLRQFQGEGVALRGDGLVALTSEAADGEAASLALLRCRLR